MKWRILGAAVLIVISLVTASANHEVKYSRTLTAVAVVGDTLVITGEGFRPGNAYPTNIGFFDQTGQLALGYDPCGLEGPSCLVTGKTFVLEVPLPPPGDYRVEAWQWRDRLVGWSVMDDFLLFSVP